MKTKEFKPRSCAHAPINRSFEEIFVLLIHSDHFHFHAISKGLFELDCWCFSWLEIANGNEETLNSSALAITEKLDFPDKKAWSAVRVSSTDSHKKRNSTRMTVLKSLKSRKRSWRRYENTRKFKDKFKFKVKRRRVCDEVNRHVKWTGNEKTWKVESN